MKHWDVEERLDRNRNSLPPLMLAADTNQWAGLRINLDAVCEIIFGDDAIAAINVLSEKNATFCGNWNF